MAVGTALFPDPTTPIGLIEGLSRYVSAGGFSSVSELVGGVARGRIRAPSAGRAEEDCQDRST